MCDHYDLTNDPIPPFLFDACLGLGPVKRVFLLGNGVSGDLGGLDGADALCDAAAGGLGLPGTYRAWLSTDLEGPADRFAQSSGPYVRTDGTLIATDWADLTDGLLEAPISPAGELAWTNTAIDGTPLNLLSDPALDSCNNWTSAASGDTAALGDPTDVGPGWTEFGVSEGFECEVSTPLYCFEQ